MTTARLELPTKLIPVFTGEARYRGAYGGRGSSKTRSFALMSAVRGYQLAESGQSGAILCAREFQNSLDESSMEEVKQSILSVPWLADYYEIGERYIRTKNRRIDYRFAGLRHNLDSIKSKTRILLCWIDEAEPVSEVAYTKLIPTIREEGSEIWVTWNPERKGSPTDKRFRVNPPEDAKIIELNYCDNPWFPATLEAQRREDQIRLDPGTYAHIWDGAYLEQSDAQVMAGKWRVAEFEPGKDWDGPYHGLDFGFAQDPTAAVRCWTHGRNLYIEHEAGKTGLEIDGTAEFVSDKIPGIEQYAIRADSARPESVSYLRRKGLPRIESVKKWSGSVEDGIQHIRSYQEVIIHPRCQETIREFRLYSYKRDRQTNEIQPVVIDSFNHYIDALRYALQPLIRRKEVIFEAL